MAKETITKIPFFMEGSGTFTKTKYSSKGNVMKQVFFVFFTAEGTFRNRSINIEKSSEESIDIFSKD